MIEKLRCMTAIYLTQNNQMLLLYRQGGRVVNNIWVGSAGGHFEKEELNDPEACVLRELQEELGISREDITDFTLKYIALRRTNHEIRQNYYFFANLKDGLHRDITSNEGVCRWFDYAELPTLEMPLSAKYVIEHYLETGRWNDKVYSGTIHEEEAIFVELPVS